MLKRQAEPALRRLAGYYPVVTVSGPRQSGKSTLVRATFPDLPYVSLEEIDVREFAQSDPRGFLGQYRDGAILDEAQRCPDLFSYLQAEVDRDPRRGRFVLTGSQQFGLLAGVSQTLAGRVGILRLLPFSYQELAQAEVPRSTEDALWRGGYPPIHDRGIPPGRWFSDYVTTYVERDVRQMVAVRDLGSFARFVRMCAARTGQLLNLSGLAADCGITHNTAKAWLSVLEASFLVHLLPAYFRNFGKRLVKAPKLCFLDAGLAAWLVGVQQPEQLAIHPMRGALFETWVLGEILKYRFNRALAPDTYYWRDAAGNEVDGVVERPGGPAALEIKAGQTIAEDYFRSLDRFGQATGVSAGALIYAGDTPQRRFRWPVYPWREVEQAARALFDERDAPSTA